MWMSVDLSGLGPHGFEEMCRALGVRVLGPGIAAFGAGPDGGREASFSGLQQFPNTAVPWNGYGIMQAKYKAQLRGTRSNTTWLRGRIKAELDAWADPTKRRVRDGRRPEYLIITTNVGLSGVPGSGGKDRIDELIKQYAADLGLRDWSIWDAPQIGTFLNAYPDVRRGFTALITPSDVLAEQVDMLRSALDRGGADEAAGRLARLRERFSWLPESTWPVLEEGVEADPEGLGQLIAAVTDPGADPEQTTQSWVEHPPAFLGTPDAPMRHAVWTAIGEIAAAYRIQERACTAFERAAAAGGARRGYLLARAAWAALQAGDHARASAAVATAERRPGEEITVEVVTALLTLLAGAEPPGAGNVTGARAPSGTQASVPSAEPGQRQLSGELRQLLSRWDPQRPADRDMRARSGAQVELTDPDPSRSPAARYSAALRYLDSALMYGSLDDTALVAAKVLRLRAETGTAPDRSGDLCRAEELALRVRDRDRHVRRDSAPAVRQAVGAAIDAGRYRQVIMIGSAIHGQATEGEARDPQIAMQVVVAAVKGVADVADALAADLRQLPDGFTRIWARASLAMRSSGAGSAGPDERIDLWEQALAAAATDDDRLEALQGMSLAGAQDLPGPDDLLGGDLATAAVWRARAALGCGDPETAIFLVRPYKDAYPPAVEVLGAAYAVLGQTDAAVDTLTTAASRFDHDDFILQATDICNRAADPARAERLLTGVLRAASPAWPGRGQASALIAELQADRGTLIDAIASWETALEADPYLDSARWQLAHTHAARGDHGRAWAVITGNPATPEDTPIPARPPTAGAAHLVLILIKHNSDRSTLLTYGLRYLELFGGDERFAGQALAMLSAPGNDPDDPDDPRDGTPDPVLAQLQREYKAYFAKYPDSPYLRQYAFTTVADLAEIVRQRPHPSQQHASLERGRRIAVASGHQPLGVISMLARDPYAYCVVAHAGGVLTAVSDRQEHAAGIADACLALGISLPGNAQGDARGPGTPAWKGQQFRRHARLAPVITPIAAVVTDATALYARTLLPALDDVLVCGIRELLLADSAYTDILDARNKLLVPVLGMLGVDPETGQCELHPASSSEQAGHLAAASAVLALAGGCTRLPLPAGGSRDDLDALAGPGLDPWTGGMRLAAARGIALWADDAALRCLARGVGVPAFSTLALLDAYSRLGLVSAGQREDAVGNLISGCVGDFAPDVTRLRTVAARDDHSRAAVCSATAKPGFWSDPQTAASAYAPLCRDLHSADVQILPALLQAAILGVTRSGFPAPQKDDLCARIAAATINTAGPLGEVDKLLQAVRAARGEADQPVPVPDILPAIVHLLMPAFERATASRGKPDIPLAAANVQGLFARCQPEDQSTVRRAILMPR
jgi:tetratricopeptide (TPR) repeat protein